MAAQRERSVQEEQDATATASRALGRRDLPKNDSLPGTVCETVGVGGN